MRASLLVLATGIGLQAAASSTFVRGEHGLWRLKFEDGSFLREADCAPSTRVEGKDGPERRWSSDAADVTVRRIPVAAGGYDLMATVGAKTRKIVSVDLPARVRFSGVDVKRFIYPGAGSTGLGLAFNDRMFEPQDPNRPDSWTDVAAPTNGYGMLFGGGAKTLGRDAPAVPLKVPASGRGWFDAATVAELESLKYGVIRPCRDGQLDLVLVDSPNGPYFGGRRLGVGEGRLWRFGAAGGNSWRWEARAERAVLTNLVAGLAVRNPSRRKVACIVLTGARNCGLFVNADVATFRKILRESLPQGCQYVELASPADIARAERASDCLLIVNPYGEGFPCGSLEKYASAIESLKGYVAAGGNWVEVGGYSFFRAMVAADFSYRVSYPPLWADFACIETKGGAAAAIYGVQPRATHRPWSYDKSSFVPGETAFGVDAKGGWYEHSFAADVKPGQVWTTPRVRVCPKDYETALADYAEANGLGRTLADKVGDAEKLEKLKKSPLFLLYGPAREKLEAIRLFPAPTTVHFCDYLRGTFDKQYPDHLPPHPTLFGTAEELAQVIAESHRLGHLVCPYTNPTWWCENPRGPTFEKWGMEPLAKKADGSPYREGYAAGNYGYTVSFWHPGAQEANRKTIREFTKDYPVDFVFQDQCARAWIADYNPASPSPLAWSAGMLAMNEEDSARVPLGTEHGWDRVVANMAMVTGSTGLIVPIGKQATSMPWRLCKNWISPDKWTIEPLATRLFHGTTMFYLHDLMASVNSDRLLAWVMALGYNLSYAHGAKSYTYRPQDRAWYEWLHVLQGEVLSKAAGEPVVSFDHDRAPLLARAVDPTDENDDGLVRAKYGAVNMLVNLGDVAREADGRRLAPYGWWIEGPSVVSGNVEGELPFVKTDAHRWEYEANAKNPEKMLICR